MDRAGGDVRVLRGVERGEQVAHRARRQRRRRVGEEGGQLQVRGHTHKLN